MLKKLIIFIVVLFILVALYYIANIYFERQTMLNIDDTPLENKESSTNNFFPVSNNVNTDQSLADNNQTPSLDDEPRTAVKDVSREDCDNSCAEFLKDDLVYCQEVCGLTKDGYDIGCEDKSGLEKDYCWKDRAIERSDFSICEKISDKNIYSTCKNRVTEDLIDKSFSN